MGWTGLRTTLAVQTHMMSYRGLSTRMVKHRIAAKGIPLDAFAHSFDHAVDVQARSLVLVMVLIYAVLLAVLQWRKKTFFGQHLVFCLHFTAFWLLAVFIGLYGGSYWILRFAATQNVNLPILNSDQDLFFVALLMVGLYAARAMHIVYHDSLAVSLIKGALMAGAFHFVLDIYRFILFLIALYTS